MSALERQSCRNLVRLGMPTWVVMALISFFGDDLMRAAILFGSICAYAVVRKRRVYPFGRILNGICESSWDKSDIEAISVRLEGQKHFLKEIAFVWLGFLIMMRESSLLWSSGAIHYFSGHNLINSIVKVPAIASIIIPHVAEHHKADAVQYLGLMLSSINPLVLFFLPLFLSVTGSSCLYWFFLYYRAGENKQA